MAVALTTAVQMFVGAAAVAARGRTCQLPLQTNAAASAGNGRWPKRRVIVAAAEAHAEGYDACGGCAADDGAHLQKRNKILIATIHPHSGGSSRHPRSNGGREGREGRGR
jgi:hypothetical protein